MLPLWPRTKTAVDAGSMLLFFAVAFEIGWYIVKGTMQRAGLAFQVGRCQDYHRNLVPLFRAFDAMPIVGPDIGIPTTKSPDSDKKLTLVVE